MQRMYSTVKALQSLDMASHPTRPEFSIIHSSRHSFHPVKSIKEAWLTNQNNFLSQMMLETSHKLPLNIKK